MTSNDSSSDSSSHRSKKRKWYAQPFNADWLNDQDLKDWIAADPLDRYIVVCTKCETKLKNTNKTSLIAHKNSRKHLSSCESKRNTITIPTIFKEELTTALSDKQKVAKAELILAAFMAEHNTPFNQCPHLVETLKQMFPDSKIASMMSMKATKCAYVIQDGIAHYEKNSLVDICRRQKFSILIDESTDISVSQILAVMVRYFDNIKCEMVDALLDSIEVQDATGEGLYIAVKDLLTKNNIPMENIVGLGADNCATMMGEHSGFQRHLKTDVPNLFVLGCVCHSFALCANHASSKLPSWLEAFVKNVCGYFGRSSKRNQQFSLLQDVTNTPKHRMLKLAQTRWLSRGQVLERIIEQWEALLLFFQSQSSVDKVDGASDIYKVMTTVGTKHMLLFLKYVIAKVDVLNVEFQSQKFRLHKLYSSVADEYRNLLSMFILDSAIETQDLCNIDPTNKSLQKNLKDIDVGGRCEALLLRESLGNMEKRFRQDALDFLVELCVQIRKRFPLSVDSILSQLRVLDVEEAVTMSCHRTKSLVRLAAKFPDIVAEIDLDSLQDQWKLLPSAKVSLGHMTTFDPPRFWHSIKTIKDGNDEPKFGLLSDFMCTMMVLPHSSACVERVFSQVNMIKTPMTNRLHAETVASRLLAKQAIARNNSTCYEWEPSRSLLEDMVKGRCHQRYVNRLKQKTQQNVLIAHVLEDVEFGEDDNPYDNLDSTEYQGRV